MDSKFLSQIADYYTSPLRIENLGDLTFVFPNKRSALFLKRYIQARVKNRSLLMPRFSTFRRFATRVTGMGEPDRFEALFMLYNAYVQAVTEQNPVQAAAVKDFDKFIFWGDMILSDFDTIDMSLADASKLYSNLQALHEIAADYLTPEQKEVIERIWGVNNLTLHIERFWKHVDHRSDSEISVSDKFLSLWDILYRVYKIFTQNLADAGMATGGIVMRRALEILKSPELSSNIRGTFVFVGLSELSTAELAIIDELSKQGRAQFFWDLQGPLFHGTDKEGDYGNRAVKLISTLMKKYPMPSDFELAEVSNMPDITIVGVPSSVSQAKGAAETVRKWLNDEVITADNAIDTAVVVPDPSQLMPLMLALPEDLPALNVTMGLPYSVTTFATLFRSIISMQMRSRKRKGNRHTYFYQDVLEVLMHPHVRLLAGNTADSVRQFIIEKRIFNVDAELLVDKFPEMAFVFTPVEDTDDLDLAYDYVSRLLEGMQRSIEALGTDSGSFEAGILKNLGEEVTKLKEMIVRYGITMHESTFLGLFESILRSKILNVEGTPLEGVQVMGVLETRALDFNNIIFMAMNERSFPRRDYIKTMIPNNLRRGYGLPPIEWSEQFYAYNFFRALSRANKAVLFYDTRPPGDAPGEISRYLTRLRYAFPDKVRTFEIDLSGIENETNEIVVEKTPEVMRQLSTFLTPGGRNISASALKNFKHCPLSFYLKNVNGLSDDDEPVDFLNAAKQGEIFHRAAKKLYDKYAGSLMTAELLRRMAADEELSRFVAVEVAHFLGIESDDPSDGELSFEGLLIKSEVAAQLRSMLLVEADVYGRDGFTYVAGEYDVKDRQWEVMPGLNVNFRMQIDRIDRLDADTLRFIDYKTGRDDISFNNIGSLFGLGKDAIFQLLVYAEAYHDLIDSDVKILPAIHSLRKIVSMGELKPLSYNRAPMEPFPALTDEFRPLLNKLFSDIFDPEVPFRQCESNEPCKYCQFSDMCGRTVKQPDF